MKNFYHKFQIGKKEKTVKQWVVYSVVMALSASLLSLAFSSDFGKALTKLSCIFAYKVENEDISRLLATICRSGEDGVVTEDEAKAITDRGSKVIGAGSAGEFLNEDRENLDRRAEEEVDYAIKKYETQYPQDDPVINENLRRAHPDFTFEQLCVLNQAERVEEASDGTQAQRLLGGAISLKYVGMKVCKEGK